MAGEKLKALAHVDAGLPCGGQPARCGQGWEVSMFHERQESRRSFLKRAGGAGVLVTAGGRRSEGREDPPAAGDRKEEEVSPAEDLMREHGVLDRILLVYEEATRRLETKKDVDPAVLVESSGIVRRFIEDYHEKLEETELFPRFEKARVLVELVGTLRTQHQAGRRLTDRIQQLATPASLKAAADRAQLEAALRQFIRMYRPHAAREDTVLFPALHRIVSGNEYDSLGEKFEDEEHRRFGEDGFEKVVDDVAGIEKRLGIDDLAQFTPAR
jgi:hemerythrin-like domain-containing protein